jgi:hypothetical protein
MLRFEVFTAVIMKHVVFWDVTPCGFVRTDVSEELIASIIRVTGIGELGTTLAVTSNRRTLRRNTQEPHGVTSQKTPFFRVRIASLDLFASPVITVTYNRSSNTTDSSL